VTPIRDFNPSGISSRTSIPPAPRGRGRVVTTIVLGAASGFLAVHGYAYLQRADILPVRDVVVEGAGDEHAREIEAYADVRDGEPLLEVDLDAVQGRVLEHPYVKTAKVRRLPPDAVGVEVVERRPVAALALGDLYLVDADGFIFKRAGVGDALDLPVITGIEREPSGMLESTNGVSRALEVLSAHANAGAPGGRVHEVRISGNTGAALLLDGGLLVKVGNENLAARFQRLHEVLQRIQAGGRVADRVYLEDDRRPERVAVRLRSASEVKSESGS